jgi:hypothetical protein
VYEILLALNQLERAYARSSITDDHYTHHCKKLIQHYKVRAVLSRMELPCLLLEWRRVLSSHRFACAPEDGGLPSALLNDAINSTSFDQNSIHTKILECV